MNLLRRVTYVVLSICLLLGVGILVVLVTPFHQQDQSGQSSFGNTQLDSEILPEPVRDRVPFSSYDTIFSRRDVFQAAGMSDENMGENGGSQNPAIQGRFSPDRYKVVGILIDGQKPEVVFEDTKSHQTFFLSVGDTIQEATIVDILPGKVILDVDGYTIEQTL